jgi:flagellar hook-associated protein FlgK
LLRDKLRKLEEILSDNNPEKLKKDLIDFFTEKDTNLSNSISKEFNKAAKESIENLFSG